jgi:2'-5' RNA ligase
VIRAFIAIELTDDIRAAIGEVQDRLKRAHLGVKVSWVKIGNIHLTLQFLGYVPEDKIPDISAALGRVCDAHEAFSVPVGGVGGFPSVNRPRVVWVGCHDADARLKTLARAVQMAMQEFGFEPEHREFAAHLTLGRIKWPRPDVTLTKLLDSLRDCACGTLRVDAVHLFESQLNPQGSIYTKLSSHTLKGVVEHGSES